MLHDLFSAVAAAFMICVVLATAACTLVVLLMCIQWIADKADEIRVSHKRRKDA